MTPSQIITPSICLYEVYKRLKRELGQYDADVAFVKMLQTNVVYLDDYYAVRAADVSLKYKLAMADAIVYATAQEYGVEVVTSDEDFQNLLVYLPKPPKP